MRRYLLHGDEAIAHAVSDRSRVSADVGLDIYRTAYGLRLRECLRKDFPTLLRLLGDEAFAAASDAYIAAYPSRHFSVRYFGRTLSAFLAQHPDYAAQRIHTELAQFEWALMDAFDAADTAIVELATMAHLAPSSWPELRLRFHPSVQHLELRTNAPSLWKAAKTDRPLPTTEESSDATSWLVWRQSLSVYFRSLNEVEAQILAAACTGARFGDLCMQLCAFYPEERVAQEAATLLKQWIVDGLIGDAYAAGGTG